VVDANYLNRGELFLAHQWTGLEIEAARAAKVLENLRVLWGRPVHLQARVNEDMWLMTCAEAGKEIKKEKITDETPPPAHIVE
jgi:stage V sporulation protein R